MLDGLLHRIRQEFLAHPGLVLTRTQAARRWPMDDATCQAAFDALIEEGTMTCIGDMYLSTETPSLCFTVRRDARTPRAADAAGPVVRTVTPHGGEAPG